MNLTFIRTYVPNSNRRTPRNPRDTNRLTPTQKIPAST